MEIYNIIKNNFINNKEIYIDEVSWSDIKNRFSKENVVSSLAQHIIEKNIKIPVKNITKEEAIKCQKGLSVLNTSIKNGTIFSRYEEDLNSCYFDESNDFNSASNYFHQENRYKTDSINSPSPYRIWDNLSFAKSMCSALYTLKFSKVNMNTLHSCLAMRKYIASQFKPSVAKAIYDYFQPTDVVDFCAGWGDRLSGFYASKTATTYYGIDANLALQKGYKEQIKTYSSFIKNKTANIEFGSSEDFLMFPPCDLIFTSPPYFGIERYSKDNTQSFNRYKKLDKWLSEFLFRTISTSYNSLRKDGVLALNISDVYMNHTINQICSPMVEYAKLIGFKHMGTYGIKMNKRINSKSYQKGIFCEPLYIFIK